MDKLTKEEVLHVAHLARIEVTEEEIEKYQVDLKQLLNEVEKINQIESNTGSILITPIEHCALMRKDQVGELVTMMEVKKNAPHTNGNFLEVPVMINE